MYPKTWSYKKTRTSTVSARIFVLFEKINGLICTHHRDSEGKGNYLMLYRRVKVYKKTQIISRCHLTVLCQESKPLSIN